MAVMTLEFFIGLFYLSRKEADSPRDDARTCKRLFNLPVHNSWTPDVTNSIKIDNPNNEFHPGNLHS